MTSNNGIEFRPMVEADLGRYPIGCQGPRQDIAARIQDLGASAILAFDGTRHVGQLQTATMKETKEAVWLAAQYDDQLVYTGDKWAFRHVRLKSRFFTTHEAGWANVPHLLERS